jgi:hypothetical protein
VDRKIENTNFHERLNKVSLGDLLPGHTHSFDHVSYVEAGGFRVKGDLPEGGTIERMVYPGDKLLIRKDVEHSFLAIGNLPAIHELTHDIRYWIVAALPLLSGDARNYAQNALAGVDKQIDKQRQDNRFVCMFSQRDTEGNVVDEFEGNTGAHY